MLSSVYICEDYQAQQCLSMKVFIDNLFLYIENRDTILKNEMMYLAQVPVKNGLSICGPFTPAVLGAYLKWWETCENTTGVESDGKKWVIVKISGSGLSGANSCLKVFEDGSQKVESVPGFMNLVRDFLRVNKDFRVKQGYTNHYTLEQIAEILRNSCNDM